MTPKLTDDQRRALLEHHNGPVAVEDEVSHRLYVIVDEQTHRRAMLALQQQEDVAAIQNGIDQMNAGQFATLEEVDARIRQKLGMPARA